MFTSPLSLEQTDHRADIQRFTRGVALAGLLAILLLHTGVSSAKAVEEIVHKTLPIGQKAPLFKTFTLDDKPFDLQENLDRNGGVLLFFWSFFCGPCREEMPVLEEICGELKGQPLTLVGVNLDETTLKTPITNFIRSQKFTYPILVNKHGTEDMKLDKMYLVTGTPTIYMIRKDGTISFAMVGRLEPDQLREAIKLNLLNVN